MFYTMLVLKNLCRTLISSSRRLSVSAVRRDVPRILITGNFDCYVIDSFGQLLDYFSKVLKW